MDENKILREIWKQASIPVVFKRERPDSLLVKLPHDDNNMGWLRKSRNNKPVFNERLNAWEIPQAWFEDTVKRAIEKFDKCYVVQLYREKQICAPACWNAGGMHCECSCMGENHGTGHPDGRWYEIDETLAVSWGEKQYAYRLVRRKS